MKNSIIPMLAMSTLGLALPLQADVLVSFDGTQNYSAADSNFARTDVESGTGPYYSTNAFSDTSQLSPNSDYTGPTFYGGYQYSSSTVEGYLSRQQIREYASGDQLFLQAFKTGGWAGSTLTLHGMYIFNQADFNSGFETGNVSLDGVSMTWTGYITTNDSGVSFDGRLAVEVGGTYYLSQSVINLANNDGSYAISGSGLANEQWAAFDPNTSLDFDSGSASFGSLSLESISAVGLYFEEDGWTGIGTSNTTFGLGIKTFTAEGTAIPESAHMSVMFGIVALLASSIVRRRKR